MGTRTNSGCRPLGGEFSQTCKNSAPGATDATLQQLQLQGQQLWLIAGDSAEQVGLVFSVASRASVRRSTFILPAVSDLAVRCKGLRLGLFNYKLQWKLIATEGLAGRFQPPQPTLRAAASWSCLAD